LNEFQSRETFFWGRAKLNSQGRANTHPHLARGKPTALVLQEIGLKPKIASWIAEGIVSKPSMETSNLRRITSTPEGFKFGQGWDVCLNWIRGTVYRTAKQALRNG